jgi:hypothetical protein
MTTNTTQGRAEATSGAVIEHPIASQTPPEVAVPHAAAEADLESRIKERRAELIGSSARACGRRERRADLGAGRCRPRACPARRREHRASGAIRGSSAPSRLSRRRSEHFARGHRAPRAFSYPQLGGRDRRHDADEHGGRAPAVLGGTRGACRCSLTQSPITDQRPIVVHDGGSGIGRLAVRRSGRQVGRPRSVSTSRVGSGSGG